VPDEIWQNDVTTVCARYKDFKAKKTGNKSVPGMGLRLVQVNFNHPRSQTMPISGLFSLAIFEYRGGRQ